MGAHTRAGTRWDWIAQAQVASAQAQVASSQAQVASSQAQVASAQAQVASPCEEAIPSAPPQVGLSSKHKGREPR
jgi:multidrug resistance efflux pump